MNMLASPSTGVVLPAFGILILLLWVGINLIESGIKRLWRRTDGRRGFEVKLNTGESPVPQQRSKDA